MILVDLQSEKLGAPQDDVVVGVVAVVAVRGGLDRDADGGEPLVEELTDGRGAVLDVGVRAELVVRLDQRVPGGLLRVEAATGVAAAFAGERVRGEGHRVCPFLAAGIDGARDPGAGPRLGASLPSALPSAFPSALPGHAASSI